MVSELSYSSLHLGLIPDSLGPMVMIDWVPVDICAKILVNFCLYGESPQGSPPDEAMIHHIVNPQTTQWSELLPSVQAQIPEQRRPKTVPLSGWVDALRGSAVPQDDSKNPAARLLPFFEGLLRGGESGDAPVTLATDKTAEKNAQLIMLDPIGSEWMTLWMKQWNS